MSKETQVMETETEVITLSEASTEIFQEYEMKETSDLILQPEDGLKVLRTQSDGCFELYKSYWGTYIRPCFDPIANVEITQEHLEHFEIDPNVHKIPAELWTRWVKLCFHFVNKVKNSVEVSVRILRSVEDPSIYRIIVPKQVVSGSAVRVDSFDIAIDIETGEEINQYPPEGWTPVGSSHSHNTMPAFFSGIDDKYELGDPGIHLVIGSIDVEKNTYTIAASVVGSGRRFELPFNNLIDATPIPSVSFHPKTLEYVNYSTPAHTYKPVRVNSGVKTTSLQDDLYNYNDWLNKYSGTKFNNESDYNDPFYFRDVYDNNTHNQSGNFNFREDLQLWEIEDLTVDLIRQHQDDINKLYLIMNFLERTVNDVKYMISELQSVPEIQ